MLLLNTIGFMYSTRSAKQLKRSQRLNEINKPTAPRERLGGFNQTKRGDKMRHKDRQTTAGRLAPLQRKETTWGTALGWVVFSGMYWAAIAAALFLHNS